MSNMYYRSSTIMSAVPPCPPGSPDDLDNATRLYEDFKSRIKTDPAFVKLSEHDKITFYHRLVPEITQKYPIIFRYMVATGQFHPKAMKMYMDKIKSSPYKTEEEYCERGADYVKYLYMKTHTHYNRKEANSLWLDTKQALQEELTDFKDRLEEIKKEEVDMESITKYERRKELQEAVERMRITESSTNESP
jgi:hypothetical protein